MGTDAPFGKKTVVLGGDFRQCLPIEKRGGRDTIVAGCMHRSELWPPANRVFALLENMRVRNCQSPNKTMLAWFATYLLRLGEGRVDEQEDADYPPSGVVNSSKPHRVRLHSRVCISAPPDMRSSDSNQLDDFVYPGLEDGCDTAIREDMRTNGTTHRAATRHFFAERAILAPYNAEVADINRRLLRQFPGEMGAPPPPPLPV